MEDSRPEAEEPAQATETAPPQAAQAEPERSQPAPPAEPARRQAAQDEPAPPRQAAPAPPQQAAPARPEAAMAAAPPAYYQGHPHAHAPQYYPHGGAQQALTPEQAAAQAAYYQRMGAPRPMLPPNPRWHRPDAVPKQAVVVMAVVVALFGAWSAFHAEGVGIGLALTGIAMVALPLAAGDRRDLVPRLPGAVLVAALWSVAAIRDAGWVVFLCSAAAFLLTPLVLAPQRRFSGTALTVSMGWLEGFAETFKWARRGRRKDGRSPTTVRNVWVGLVTVVLLLVFGGLFAAADSTFADLIARLLPDLSPGEFILRLLFAAVLLPLVLVWTYMAVAKPAYDSDGGEHRTISRFELAVPLGALNLLFAAFIAVQLRVYVGGEQYVRTMGLSFAEYARTGFWQLSVVAALSLAVIAIAAWLAPKRGKADRWTVRILLAPLCLMSMVVIASALFRMYTYVESFGLTRMRIWIFTVEIWLAVLFALVVVCCWKLRASWLPRAVLATGALALLGLAAINPDALIARFNIDHERELDLYYLEGLSADAVPELTGLTEDQRDCLLYEWADRAEDREPLAWNWGFHQAAEIAEGTKEPTGVHCFEPSGDGLASDDSDESDGGYDSDATDDGNDSEVPGAYGFFHWDTCAMYDLASVTELFGTSAGGDRGVVADDPSQYAEELLPGQGRGDRVLHCGYYGPGTKYLMIETYEWASAVEAATGLEAMRTEREADELYTVADLGSETVPGYTTVIGENPADIEYVAAVEEIVVVVSLADTGGDGAVAADVLAVGDDLLDQSHALYLELA
jgi:hypothetical protein